MYPERPFEVADPYDGARNVARAVFVTFMAFLCAYLVATVGSTLLVAGGVFPRGSLGINVAGSVLQFVGFGVGVGVYFTIGRFWHLLRLRVPTLADLGWTAAGVVAIFVAAAVVGQIMAELGVSVAQNQVVTLGQQRPEFFLYMIPVSLLFVGPFEELVFRGAVQGLLRRAFGAALAIGIASALFGLVHWIALTGAGSRLSYIATAAALGLILGYIYERTRNLAVPALVHGIYNSVLFAVQYAVATGLVSA